MQSLIGDVMECSSDPNSTPIPLLWCLSPLSCNLSSSPFDDLAHCNGSVSGCIYYAHSCSVNALFPSQWEVSTHSVASQILVCHNFAAVTFGFWLQTPYYFLKIRWLHCQCMHDSFTALFRFFRLLTLDKLAQSQKATGNSRTLSVLRWSSAFSNTTYRLSINFFFGLVLVFNFKANYACILWIENLHLHVYFDIEIWYYSYSLSNTKGKIFYL